MVLSTPEKERRSSLPEELSLTLTPGQEDRQEQRSNCCPVVSTDHPCEEYITPEVLSPQKPNQDDFYTLEVTCSKEVFGAVMSRILVLVKNILLCQLHL